MIGWKGRDARAVLEALDGDHRARHGGGPLGEGGARPPGGDGAGGGAL